VGFVIPGVDRMKGLDEDMLACPQWGIERKLRHASENLQTWHENYGGYGSAVSIKLVTVDSTHRVLLRVGFRRMRQISE
jgi:hypothetical protein